ncbi:MAG: OmpA family protein [Burkholderiaceae bacterium]|nr:OmpA family protein [Burkholderiaceae bacterium]
MRDFISFQRDAEHNETAGTHRWMVSYADFVTLLFVLFLVLYAKLPKQPEVPTVPPPAVQGLHQPVIAGIRPRHAALAAQAKPTTLLPDSVSLRQQALLDELAHTFSDRVDAGEITLVTREQGVLLEVKDTALFASGTAQPAAHADLIIDKIVAILAKTSNKVVVEGHTDNVPIQNAQFPSNWELSSARAASVVRALQERGIAAYRLSASGLADTKPISSNDTARGRSENRRVSLLLLNG